MSLHLTPEMLETAYELLRATPPFRRWKLPPADEVALHAVPIKDRDQADYSWDGTRHQIRVNPQRHTTLRSVLETLAHEMVHLRLQMAHPEDKSNHGWRFQRLADQVCRHHQFDRGQF